MEHAHAHPMPGDRRFEHVHRLEPAALDAGHPTMPLEQAHPDLADVTHAPEPGSPADLHQRALWMREQAAWHRSRAEQYDREADALEVQAVRDKAEPPTEQERIRRLFS